MSVYISGSLAYDRIMTFEDKFTNHILPEKLHILNLCFLVSDLEEKFGGTAGNIAYSLSLLEEKPTILATAGNDFDRYKGWLNDNGLNLEGIKIINDFPTASAYITTDQADNQITAFNLGEAGATIEDHSGETKIAAVNVKRPIDPTGCGDAFRAGLIKGLRDQKTLKQSAEMGATCASFCQENNGTQEHTFKMDEFWSRYNRKYLTSDY